VSIEGTEEEAKGLEEDEEYVPEKGFTGKSGMMMDDRAS